MDNQSFMMQSMGNHIHIPINCTFFPVPPSKYTIIFFPQQCQFFVTPFPFEYWRDLWRIRLALVDEPGLLNEIVDILQKLNLNILSEVSGVSRGYFHVELVIFAGEKYKNEIDKTHNVRCEELNRALRYVEAVLLANFLSRLRLITIQQGTGKAQQIADLKIDRMRAHYDLHYEYNRNVDEPHVFCKSVWEIEEEDEDNDYDYWIKLPGTWYDELLKKGSYLTANGGEPEMTYIASSSARNQLLTLTFLKSHEQWERIRIKHEDRIGAIFTFTDVIKDKINLTASATIKLNAEKNLWEFMYETVNSPGISPEELVKSLNTKKVKGYKPTIELRYDNCWHEMPFSED